VVKCTQKTAICIPSRGYQFHTSRSHICSNTTQKNISIIDMNSVSCHVTIAQSLQWLLQTLTRIPIVHTTSLDLWIANRLTRTVHKDTCKGTDKFIGSKITIIVKKLPTKCSPEVNWHQCHWMDKAALRNQDLGYNRLPSTHYFTCNLHRNKPEVQWKLSFHRTISKSQSWTYHTEGK
jgi:hypothetical protein